MVLAGTLTQKALNPLTLLAQLVGRQITGELLVVTGETRWSLWLQRGKLTFATSSQNGFNALRFETRQLFPSAMSDLVLAQLQLYHRQYAQQGNSLIADYRSICWLVDQEHISADEATELIRSFAITTLTSLLEVTQGSYEVNDPGQIKKYPIFCSLEIRPLVEQCHREAATLSRDRSRPGRPAAPAERSSGRKPAAQPQQDADIDIKDLLRQASSQPFDVSMGLESSILSEPPVSTELPDAPLRYQLVCVDSDKVCIQELHSYLEDTVFSINSVEDAVTALTDLANMRPDLILLTTSMPGLDGFEVCVHLRRHPEFKDIPIILMAQRPNIFGRLRAKLCGASVYLGKPLDRTQLMVKLFMLLV